MFYVYILKSSVNGDLYVGRIGGLRNRVELNNGGFVRSTKANKPCSLIYTKLIKTKEIQLEEKTVKKCTSSNQI